MGGGRVAAIAGAVGGFGTESALQMGGVTDPVIAWTSSIFGGLCVCYLAWSFLQGMQRDRASLSISGPFPVPLRSDSDIVFWRIRVHNKGAAAAQGVQMKLWGITPRPQCQTWLSAYPYTVTRAWLSITAPDALIGPGESEDFDILKSSKDGDSFFVTLAESGNGGSPQIIPDESWELKFTVSADNADPLRFAVEVMIDHDQVLARMAS